MTQSSQLYLKSRGDRDNFVESKWQRNNCILSKELVDKLSKDSDHNIMTFCNLLECN